eukprot:12101123-Alexandrium_andersonii.AAC.1
MGACGTTPPSPVGWACLRRNTGFSPPGHGVPVAQRHLRPWAEPATGATLAIDPPLAMGLPPAQRW